VTRAGPAPTSGGNCWTRYPMWSGREAVIRLLLDPLDAAPKAGARARTAASRLVSRFF
jgi:hypothetical protein